MQCGSRFSVIRCVKTRPLQTTSLSRNEFLPRRNRASVLPRIRDMQMSQTQRDFTQLRRRQRISFLDWNQAALQRLLVLGHDRVRCARGAHSLENADVVGPNGMAMIAIIADCCEITA